MYSGDAADITENLRCHRPVAHVLAIVHDAAVQSREGERVALGDGRVLADVVHLTKAHALIRACGNIQGRRCGDEEEMANHGFSLWFLMKMF